MIQTGWTLAALLALVALVPLAGADEAALPVESPDNPVAVIKTSMGDVYVELFVKEAPKTVANFLGLAEGTKEFKDPTTEQTVARPYYDGLVFHRVIKNFMIQGGCPLGTGSGDPGFKFEDEIDATALGLADMKVLEDGAPNKLLNIRNRQQWQQKVLLPLLRNLGIAPTPEEVQANEAKIKTRLDTLTIKELYEWEGYRYQEGTGAHAPKKGVLAMANSGPNSNGSQFFLNLVDTDWLMGRHTVFGKIVKGMDVVEKIGGVAVAGGSNKPTQDVKILSIRRLGD